jgi:NAD(P)H-hydrate epimerase
MVRADVDVASALALQIAAPFATVGTWQAHTPQCTDRVAGGALVIGPGLDGTRRGLRHAITRLLHECDGPVVLDAGALTAFAHHDMPDLFAGDDAYDVDDEPLQQLRHALRGRPALLTPHIGEFRRLGTPGDPPIDRYAAPRLLAQRLNATVLLKGVPTVIAAPDGQVLVSARGNAALGMGGSGDLLAGMAGALLAQQLSPLHAGAIAALAHGCAAEIATFHNGGTMRGVTMSRLLDAVPSAWHSLLTSGSATLDEAPAPPVVHELVSLPTR